MIDAAPRTAPLALLSGSADPTIALLASVPLGPGDATSAPDWIHLLHNGEMPTRDGRGPFKLTDAAGVAKLSLAGSDPLPVDQNHATDLAAPLGMPSPAVGWIVALEARGDGLWGKVDWTGAGQALLSDKAYRHISPVIAHAKDGTVTRVLRASLTNLPNLIGLTALNHQTLPETTMDLKTLRDALKLPEADEPTLLSAIATLQAKAAVVTDVAEVLGVGAGADRTALLAAVKATAGAPTEVKALQTQLAAQAIELNAMSTTFKRDKAETYIDGAIKAGHVGLKPLRDHYIARHMQDPAAVEKEIAAMPVLLSDGRSTQRQPAPGGGDQIARLSAGAGTAEISAAAERLIADRKAKGLPEMDFAQAARAVAPLV